MSAGEISAAGESDRTDLCSILGKPALGFFVYSVLTTPSFGNLLTFPSWSLVSSLTHFVKSQPGEVKRAEDWDQEPVLIVLALVSIDNITISISVLDLES